MESPLITLIPAAGAGTRMRPMTHTLPKAMLPVAGKPILAHIIDKAIDAGSQDIVIIVEYLKETIIEEIPKLYPNLRFTFVRQGEMQGLGHAIYKAKDYCLQHRLLIIYGDTLFDADLSPVVLETKPMFGVYRVDDPSRFGVILTNQEGLIIDFVEKPDQPISHLALPGVIYFPNATMLFEELAYILDHNIKTKGEYQVTDAYKRLAQKKIPMGYFELDGWYDCGKHKETLLTNRTLLEKQGSTMRGKVKDCEIIDPVFIDEECVITNSTIGPYVSIGKKNMIEGSKIENSILDAGNHITGSTLTDSLLGRHNEIQAYSGTIALGDHNLIGKRQP